MGKFRHLLTSIQEVGVRAREWPSFVIHCRRSSGGGVWVSFVICCRRSSGVGDMGKLHHLLSSIQRGRGMGKFRHLLLSIQRGRVCVSFFMCCYRCRGED